MSNDGPHPAAGAPAAGAAFFGDGFFDWQLPANASRLETWKHYSYNRDRWWGGFSPETRPCVDLAESFPWALGPFTKYADNPIIAPSPGAWDCGHASGGVHNGSILRHNGEWHYLYRGERPIDVPSAASIPYIGDIGLATSRDGIHFTKDTVNSPFFRKGEDRRYSYEDVCCVRHGTTYYLFCNQWLWEDNLNPACCGVFLATSSDLRHWHKQGLVFPNATRIHRNGVVIQNPENNAVRINGRFVMYINDGLMGYSEDMLHWESVELVEQWPGGEGCVALADYNPVRPDDILLFTGGHHTGHFYAIGEVLFNKSNPAHPIEWLPQPVLTADKSIPYENGFSATNPNEMISYYADCIFFNGLARHDGKWWMYYGGSEYYTCLATALA